MNPVIELLTEHIGTPQETTSEEVRFNSPFEEHFDNPNKIDHTYHLYVNPVKGVFIDYKSGLSGGLKYLFKLLKIDPSGIYEDDYRATPSIEAIRDRLDKMQERLVETIPRAPLPEWYTPVTCGSPAHRYLSGRGVSDEEIVLYRIGQGLEDHAQEVIIPSFGEDGECDFWVTRNIYRKIYLNPRVPRRHHVGFLTLARMFSSRALILCEGAFSAIAAGRDAVCTYGKLVTNEQLKKMRRVGVEELTISLDPDALREAMDSARRSLELGFRVYMAFLPKGKDPADLGQKLFREQVLADRRRMTTTNLLRYKADRLRD